MVMQSQPPCIAHFKVLASLLPGSPLAPMKNKTSGRGESLGTRLVLAVLLADTRYLSYYFMQERPLGGHPYPYGW